MRRLIEEAAPVSFDARSWSARPGDRTPETGGERIRIVFDLPDGPARVSADPREIEELFGNLVVNVGIAVEPGGRLTIHLAPDDLENMPDETEIADPSRWLHVAIEDRGNHTVGTLLRRLLDPLINVAPQLVGRTGSLRWSGRILFEENDDASRVIHLLLPYEAERARGH